MKATLPLLVLLAAVSSVFAGAPAFSEPILLTSCGQSADVLMMKTLLGKDSLVFSYLPQATAADLAGKKSLIVVLGGSSKGLGAAKISEADETARVTALLDSARALGLSVLAVHMGGANRRGALSDPFNRLGAIRADHIIVAKGGNEDGFFTKIAAESGAPLDSVDNALKVAPVVRALFRPAESK